MKRIPAVAAVLLLAACATMDKGECVNANWYAVGLEDGAQGRGLERLGDHRRACAEHNVQPDAERYAAGRMEGLKSFCTYDRGYSHGRAGNAYSGACPAPASQDFLAGYRRGRDLHEAGKRRDEVNAEIRKTKAGLAEPGASPQLRAQLAEKLEALTRESTAIEQQIARLQARR